MMNEHPLPRHPALRDALLCPLLVLMAAASPLRGQESPAAQTEPPASTGDWLIHGQSTYILQGHGSFPSPYEGPNSFQPRREALGSFSATLYLGWRPWNGGELIVTPELLGGRGDSRVLGIAGAPNGEIYRVNNPDVSPSLSRVFLRQTWNLDGGESQRVEEGAMNFGGARSSRRITFTAGKMAMNDIFDADTWINDPRTGFLNWALMDTGSWDYPADTRGYSWGFTVELAWDAWTARLGSYMEPREANQMDFDKQVSRAHGDVLEVVHDHRLGDLPGRASLLVYANHARMGVYAYALAQDPAAPDVAATEAPGRTKYGLSTNLEQALTPDIGVFCRAGWNDGQTQSWAFTEIDRTLALGISGQLGRWGRPGDRFGAACVVNGLSAWHRAYLAAGGQGFILGDGRLAYAQERILEAYYSVGLGSHASFTADYQRVQNPGCNRDRGPVDLFAGRIHLQF